MRYSDHEQRQMDIASGEELDRHAERRTRYVACERCGGSGEVEVRPIVGPYEDPTPDAEICSACEGTGRFCVEPDEVTP
jgi:DnaJ-class molecular chaperone